LTLTGKTTGINSKINRAFTKAFYIDAE